MDLPDTRSAKPAPFSSLMSWPPHPAVTYALIASRSILLVDDLVTCVLSFVMASNSTSFLLLGIFMSFAMPLVIYIIVLEYQMLPRKKDPKKQGRSWARGQRGRGRYSALGNREESDHDHDHDPADELPEGLKNVHGRNLKIALALDLLGLASFVTLYVFTTIDAADSWYNYNTVGLTYASVGALVAWIIHLCCLMVELLLLFSYCRHAKVRCPHCNRVMRNYLGSPSEGSYISPVRLPARDFVQGALFGPEPETEPDAVPGEGSMVNVKGEAENHTLLAKDNS